MTHRRFASFDLCIPLAHFRHPILIGNTGIVWGHMAIALKPKDGSQRAMFTRFTFVFAKVDGKWQEVAVHGSTLPSGN